MRLMPSALAAVALSVGACGIAIGQSADVTLIKKPGESGVVEATFVLSKPTQRLRFPEGGDMRRLSWRPGDSAKMAGDGQSITFAQPVRSFTVELRPDVKDGQFDRRYIPVMPLNGGRAAAVYADYLLPRDGGVVRIAGEGVAFGRRVKDRRPVWGANDATTYLLVGTADVKSSEAYAITLDSQLPPWVAVALPKRVEAIMELYASKFASRPSHKPWIVAGYEPTDASDRPPLWADVSGHMVRLSLAGTQWQQEDAGQAYLLDVFVAHELAHLWNNGLWQTAADQPNWLHEGGAQAVALDALRTLSGDQERYASEVSAAFRGCLSTNGRSLQEKTSRGGGTHYDCGAALFHMASALVAHDRGQARPMDFMAKVFERQRGTKVYSVQDVVDVARQSTGDAAALQDLVEVITSERTFVSAVRRSGASLGVRMPGDKELDQRDFAVSLLNSLMAAVMRQDCEGVSLQRQDEAYTLRTMPSCKRITQTLTYTSLEGVNMHGDPSTAIRHATARCEAGKELHLATAEGKELELPCEWTPPPIAIDG